MNCGREEHSAGLSVQGAICLDLWSKLPDSYIIISPRARRYARLHSWSLDLCYLGLILWLGRFQERLVQMAPEYHLSLRGTGFVDWWGAKSNQRDYHIGHCSIGNSISQRDGS
jgi:hypothetical protein